MCLGQIVRVRRVREDGSAAASLPSGQHIDVSLVTLDHPVAPGDWLVVHSGFALDILTAGEASAAGAIRATSAATPAPSPAPHRKDNR